MDNIKVNVKILIMVVIAVVGMAIIGIRGAVSINDGHKQMQQMYDVEIKSVELLGNAESKMRTIQVRSMQVIADPTRLTELSKAQQKDISEMEAILQEYATLAKMDGSADGLDEMLGYWDSFKKSMPAVMTAVQQGGTQAGIDEYNRKGKDDTVKLRDSLNSMTNITKEKAKAANEAAIESGRSSMMVMLITTIVCVLLLLAFSYKLINSIRDALNIMVHVCDKLSSGNFIVRTEPSQRKDELGDVHRALYDMTLKIGDLLKEVSKTTEQMAAASQQLNSSSMESANAATSVAQSVADAASVVVQQQTAVTNGADSVASISQSVKSISQETEEISQEADQAAKKAEAGNLVVEKSVNQIHSVEEKVRTTARLVDELGARSQEIGAIVDTISDLAGQTNLLALNAAIEAARAGEQGRGFAVVAEEVRKLAEQSATAAQQIADLIGRIQDDTSKAVASMDSDRQAVVQGAESVEGLRQVFEEINGLVIDVAGKIESMSDSIQHVADQSSEITNHMEQIDTGAAKVADNMQSISAATEEQSASAQEIASASDSLARQAQDVQENLQKFKF
ncbi:methyl-accepting chemotaxis protein [Anaerovibrio lipolyticus]|uniref:methyl-accepting chemotaxis protein n=1 Tax=Anaerovibrio lipolyticus TaxID=82374 RepID=UPI001F2023F5|nr:methyl-accepting chemotaxis protein [Anaerovibrio lipolyticus]MCF2601088.1 methyl-accepting chemotaxis protein [Anaerovibrio lipolyticus]